MSATNPTWDNPFGPRFGGIFGPGFGPGFGGGFGPRGRGGRGGRGGPHRRPPFGPGPEGPDVEVTVNIDSDDPADRLRARRGGRGGPFGPGFGPGGPFGPGFGPGGFGPRGRGFGPGRRGPGGRGRRGRGDVRLAVLALVAEQPRHGYEIIQEVAERSGGRWKPSPGSVYPTLSQLEDEGLVSVEKTDGRRVVQLTEAGTTYVAEHREELDKVWTAFDSEEEDGPDAALWQQLAQLHAAAQQVMATGTPEQLATATETLTEARKTLYRLLAE